MPTAEDEVRERLRREGSVGRTISGLAQPLWPAPPLLLPVEYGGALPTPPVGLKQPEGPLVPFVGERIKVLESIDTDMLMYAGESEVNKVLAWPVVPLLGAHIEVSDYADIPEKVRALLATALPGIDFWVPENHWEGSFRKHGFLHHCFPAPPNQATGEAMSIELFGVAQQMLERDSEEYLQHVRDYARRGDPDEASPSQVVFPATVVIEVATYSNVTLPSVGIAMYG